MGTRGGETQDMERQSLTIIASAPHRDLIWNDLKKQNKLRQTKFRRTVAMSPRCFKKPTYKATLLIYIFIFKKAVNENAVKNFVIHIFSLLINLY